MRGKRIGILIIFMTGIVLMTGCGIAGADGVIAEKNEQNLVESSESTKQTYEEMHELYEKQGFAEKIKGVK